jgi:hypothetical protein
MFFLRSNLTFILSGQRPERGAKGAKMAQYLAEEHLNLEGEPDKKTRSAVTVLRPMKKRLYKKKARLVIDQEDNLNADSSHDSNFIAESSDSNSSGNDTPTDNEPLTNAEVSNVLFLCPRRILISLSSSLMSFL